LATPSFADADEHPHDHTHETRASDASEAEQGASPDAERLVVTASPLGHSEDELAIPVSSLDRGELVEGFGGTLGDTLQRIPGISTTGYARGASRPVIRGQDAFRTEVLEDGLPSQDVSRLSPDHGIPTSPLSARSIEVVHGPATLRYGGGATAGVVNAITNRVPRELHEPAPSVDVYSGFETNGNEGVVAAEVDTGAGPFAFHFDGLYRNADRYETGTGAAQPGSQGEAAAGSFGASWIGERGRLGAAYSHFRNDYGIPEAGEDVEIQMDANRLRVDGELFDPLPGFSELRLRSVYTDYEHDEVADGVVGQTFDDDEVGGRLELVHDELAGFTGALGLDARYRDLTAGGEAAEFLAPATSRTVALYGFEERPLLADLHAELGLRVESTRVVGEPLGGARRARDFVPLSGSIGLVQHVGDAWTFGALAAATQRAPSDVELFARGPHEATGTFEMGGADLDEETAFTGEVRAQADYERVRGEAAFFVTRYRDYVYGRLTGNTVDETGAPVLPTDPAALDELVYEARDALFYGGELSVEADVLDLGDCTLVADGRLDWVRARFRNVGGGVDRDVPRITPVRWGGGLGVRGDRARARIGFVRTEEQDDVAEGESDTQGFVLLDASVVVPVPVERLLGARAGGVEVDLVARGTNLTDEVARNHIAVNKDDVLLQGRSFRVGLHG
ncbi:MAG: TonB-dependent receptor, partial [Myxococcales bacterium]|nr:TonB-dependent receptor [Myxococcales bacterium]